MCLCYTVCALVLKVSDYLSVLFYLYDSDDDEEGERHKLVQLQREEMISFLYPPTFTLRMMHDDLHLKATGTYQFN